MKRISSSYQEKDPRISLLMKAAALAAAIYASAGCTLMQRPTDRGADDSTSHGERVGAARDEAASELGLGRSEDLTYAQRRALESRLELKRLERSDLEGRREREQYYRAKPVLRADADRIAFLRVGNFEGRERWLRAQGIAPNSPGFSADVRELIQENDVAVGMSKQAVKESWGEPEAVDVAGNPVYGNERWKYVEQIASPEGYQSESRLIYFEGGRVVGWEKF